MILSFVSDMFVPVFFVLFYIHLVKESDYHILIAEVVQVKEVNRCMILKI